ncbi:MAG: porin family protein [Alphaproteobacteria bacterium]|nr:MAG: porin family protein [Alphaproteobacteria bacterium]
MKKLILASVGAVVIFTWTGFYFGAHGGGGWSHKTETGTPFPFFGDTLTPAQFSVDASGWLAGGQIGAMYQVGSWVFGAEADASGSDLKGSSACSSTSISGAVLPANCSVTVRGLGTFAGRMGFALDRLLVYGKAGGAWANDLYNAPTTATDPVNGLAAPTFAGNETRWGWMAGAGVEYAFYDNWSAKIEYNYLGFRHTSLQFTDATGLVFQNIDIQQQIHIVKAGINYRWGWAPVGIRY